MGFKLGYFFPSSLLLRVNLCFSYVVTELGAGDYLGAGCLKV